MNRPSAFLKRLHLESFKSFAQLDLELGNFTAILGANGSGKSNLVAAIRFLEGVGRRQTLTEILDELPGGSAEIAFGQGNRFAVEVVLDFGGEVADISYRLDCQRGPDEVFVIAREQLWHEQRKVFQTELGMLDGQPVAVTRLEGAEEEQLLSAASPVLWQLQWDVPVAVTLMRRGLSLLRTFDFSVEGLRSDAPGGELGRTGAHLAGALQGLEPETRETVLNWVRELEPGLASLAFDDGLVLVDGDGSRWRGGGAAEGTLRFLACLAAIYESPGQGLTLFENVESGLHPTRLGLLMSMLQSRRLRTDCWEARQVLFTTHSPLVLQWLDPAERLRAVLTSRRAGQRETQALPLGEQPHLLEGRTLSQLLAAGWGTLTG